MNVEFDPSSIPLEFNPLATLDNTLNQRMYENDNKLFIEFRTDPVMNPSKSTQAGRPIFDDIDMIIIRTPGSQLTSIVAPVKRYLDRFGDKYEKWKTTQKQAVSGTPLENFPFFFGKPSSVAELKALHIYTVEQLADLPDVHKQRIMGAHELCKRAKDWLNKTDIAAADAEKEAQAKRIADLEEKIALLTEVNAKTPEAVATKSAAATKG